jgi:hypothetical protein
MSVFRTLPFLPLMPWAAVACGGRAVLQDASTVRDSAGVRIVESVRGTWSTPWQVTAQPVLSIGSVDDPDQLLDQVTGAAGLPGGGIVVANGGSLELLFYDEAGNLLRRAGGRGGGPGEFQSLEWLSRHGTDSILVLDVWNQRVSYYDAAGNFGRSVHLQPSAQNPVPRPVGVFSDGSFLATKGLFSLGGDPPVRIERTEEPLFRFAADGSRAVLLGMFPGPESAIAPVGPLGQWERRGRPFGRQTAFAAAGDRFYVGDNASYEIRVYAAAGRLLQVIRKTAAPLVIEAEDVAAFEDSVLATGDARQRRQMRVLFERIPPPPETYPAYAPDIRVDGEQNVWVRESSRPGQRRSAWSVFSATGELLGTVQLPPGVHVLEIGADYVLCLERDDLDVEYVRKLRFHRSG